MPISKFTNLILSVSAGTIMLLIAGNAFFIKRLVEQLDSTKEIVWQLRQEVVVLKLTMENSPHCKDSKGGLH